MTKKKLNWRLGKLPTPDEVRELVKDKIITQDEAREILFKEEDETERDIKSLESEIKFLRELVDKLSKNTSTIVETIRYIEKPYIRQPWYQQYEVWCGNTTNGLQGGKITLYSTANTAQQAAFSSINTF